jgi:hypothetical protein
MVWVPHALSFRLLLVLMLLSPLFFAQGYQVARVTLSVHGRGDPLRITADCGKFEEAIKPYLPLKLAREDSLQLVVELEPFRSAPEQAMLLLFNNHTGVQHALPAVERHENRVSFRFVPGEHLMQEPYLLEDTFLTMLLIAGSDETEAPVLWSGRCTRQLEHTERMMLHVDLRPTPKPRRPGVFERNFTVHWELQPEFAIRDRPTTPKTSMLLASVFALAVMLTGVTWVGLLFSWGLLIPPLSLEKPVQAYALVWQACLGLALGIFYMFFRKWNLMQTLWYLAVSFPGFFIIGFMVLRRRHEAALRTAENRAS